MGACAARPFQRQKQPVSIPASSSTQSIPRSWTWTWNGRTLCEERVGCTIHRAWDETKGASAPTAGSSGFRTITFANTSTWDKVRSEESQRQCREMLCWIANHPFILAIMAKHNYCVDELAEVDHEKRVAGRNTLTCCGCLGIRKGESRRIVLQLTTFRTRAPAPLPADCVIDTVLHELSHCDSIGHRKDFHQIEHTLREEYRSFHAEMEFPDQPSPRACCCQSYY